MILPNLCARVKVEGALCASLFAPHPSYLREEDWRTVDDVVVDVHTVELMRLYTYQFHYRHGAIVGIELDDPDEAHLLEYSNNIKKLMKNHSDTK